MSKPITNTLARKAEFSVVESADVIGAVDILQDHGDGRLEVVRCMTTEEIPDAKAAAEMLDTFHGGFIDGMRAARIADKISQGAL